MKKYLALFLTVAFVLVGCAQVAPTDTETATPGDTAAVTGTVEVVEPAPVESVTGTVEILPAEDDVVVPPTVTIEPVTAEDVIDPVVIEPGAEVPEDEV